MLRSSALAVLLLCAVAVPTARAQAPALEIIGDHHVVGESGKDRRAVYGSSDAGTTLRFYAVDKASPAASCAGTPLTSAIADPAGRWNAVIDDFDGIAFMRATNLAASTDCLPVFLSSLPVFGSAGTRSGTAITFTHWQRRSNPGSDTWPTGMEFVATQLQTNQIASYQSRPATVNVGGIVLESPAYDRPWRDLGNMRFGTSYIKLHSRGNEPLGAFTRRLGDLLYGHTAWPYMRVRVYAGGTCDPGQLIRTAYADDHGNWATAPLADAATAMSVAYDFDGTEPVPSGDIPLSTRLSEQFWSSNPSPQCYDDVTPAETERPAAPTDVRLVPDPDDPGGAIVRGTLPPAGPQQEGYPDRIGAYAARGESCASTGAFLAPTSTRPPFAADGLRITDTGSLDLDRVAVRLWRYGDPSACALAIAPSERTLSLALGAAQVTAGDATPVTLKVANAGPWPSVATSVRLRAGSGAELRPGGDCTADGADLVCAVPAVAAGAARTLTASVVGASGTPAITATLAPHRRDTDPADDTATAALRVAARPADTAPVPAPLAPLPAAVVAAAAPSAAPVCRSRRAFTVSVPAPRRTVRRVVVRLDGLPLTVVRRAGRASAVVDLRGRRDATYTVIIKRTPVRGRSTYETRRFRTCS